MSITIERSKFIHGGGMPCGRIYNSQRFPTERGGDLDSCSSSSIGGNSDLSGGSSDGGDESGGETEVQSSFKGPLDTMDALEEVLPVKRGISSFYSGKSKSFTSLADASSATSIKDLEKGENPYTRKRKNLLAHSNFLDKSHNYTLKNSSCGISKRPANTSRSPFPMGVTTTSSGSNNKSEDSNSVSTSASFCLPPLPPHGKKTPCSSSPPPPPRRNSPWRSFSLSDLQCVAAATPNITGLTICSGDKNNKLH
ncbi:protein OXIDATIVE STRESS 3 LIKE 1-like [Alnus glutinosa]|uniref:protein OXIDATIVE STRESS 3 LIKE 1-like n=1 Tax=Alnus glutinosa TaxID=3517 RepID=UPI002D76D35C|nr:protein OXIDATIVE STRESS 3 LIKE 1-like [Alnus glutinosa]